MRKEKYNHKKLPGRVHLEFERFNMKTNLINIQKRTSQHQPGTKKKHTKVATNDFIEPSRKDVDNNYYLP